MTRIAIKVLEQLLLETTVFSRATETAVALKGNQQICNKVGICLASGSGHLLQNYFLITFQKIILYTFKSEKTLIQNNVHHLSMILPQVFLLLEETPIRLVSYNFLLRNSISRKGPISLQTEKKFRRRPTINAICTIEKKTI